MVKLITYDRSFINHVSQHVIVEFEESIKASGGVLEVANKSVLLDKLFRYAFSKHRLFVDRIPFQSGKGISFSVLMGTTFEKMFPHFLVAEQRNAYLFDAWPNKQPYILAFLRRSAMANVFFSSQQVTELMRVQAAPYTRSHWMPEGILPARYKAYDYDQRDIDVLQFGRRYDALHERIVGPLAAQSLTYLYEREKGRIIFTTEDAFIDGLARAKISICVPSSITHPNRAGHISTMTVRYLQSMVSKCLVVGIMPDEMKELFPYTPVIALDQQNPAGQLLDLLRNYHQYTDLIERNYQYVCAHHTWANRWQAIRRIIDPAVPTAPVEPLTYQKIAS